MKTILWSLMACGAFVAGPVGATVRNAKVGQLSSTYINSDCILFTLEGVTEADGSVQNNPWYSIPRSQFGSKDAYAMLLAAKLSGQSVWVAPTGLASTCGYAGVYQVWMD